MNTPTTTTAEHDAVVPRYRALLAVSEAIVACRDLSELIRLLSERLQSVVASDYVSLILHDPVRDVMTLHVLHMATGRDFDPGPPLPTDDSPAGWVLRHQRPLVVDDLDAETRWPRVVADVRQIGVRTLCDVPLTTSRSRLGALGFGRMSPAPFTGEDVSFLSEVARLVAAAVENAVGFGNIEALRKRLERERDRLRLLLDVNNAVVSNLELQPLFAAISESLHRAVPHEFASLALLDEDGARMTLHSIEVRGVRSVAEAGQELSRETSQAWRAVTTRAVVRAGRAELEARGSRLAKEEGIRSFCCVPLVMRDRALGSLNAGSLRDDGFDDDAVDLLRQVANQLAIAVDNAMSFKKIAELKEKLAQEKLYLEGEIRSTYNFDEIVGESESLRRALRQARIVAPTDSTVLIEGETGTGKELVARAIHDMSARRDRTLVKINCAAIPTGLLESELFGHEKGAFTGAVAQRIGRFELAHRGTLFLDEVGDIPLDLQPKLLRVLQEREFERLGASRTQRVDVRLVAATNRDLAAMVESGRFRRDLYYRLNVFPINLPSLRERRDDVPALVRYFAQTVARRMNKRIESIPEETMSALQEYAWPGNVRELENLVERAVILSEGPTLDVPLGDLRRSASAGAGATSSASLEAVEREHIVRVLVETKWVLGGRDGAAARLGMKRTTLQSRLAKLGIRKPD